ncbi:hypothetical protein SAMN04488109_6468 [Chryseolinea serpens]|uniref:Uncharacterized protein n=1 Tax=Chryseolinea serpens TaxID=947013 RepID=A0A1M5XES3_9BACT|nr:hypothetical protein [Chryseolinea serpens]SHH98320.1 hypothetical protein SAMN04488109_6468 [Chryseolinea serpens]
MADEFKPTVGNGISQGEAEAMIKKYDDQLRADKGKDTKSVFFGKDAINEILNQPGDECAGISFFLALKYSEFAQKDVVDLIMVGTKEDGTLLWKESAALQDGAYDGSLPCPPYCPK